MTRTSLGESTMNLGMPQLDNLPCGAIANGDGSVSWRVWAPRARSVDLVLYGFRGKERILRMQSEADGCFTSTLSLVAEGQRYAYRLDGGPPRPDPASRWQPDGVHRPSAVIFLERFGWSEGDWSGLWREQLVLYELHVGTFTAEGTFDAIIPRLETLRELGVTAIELMPVAQFPGRRGWGYDGVHPYAVQNSYGGPRALQRLVNACHRTGMAVFLDVVYNHCGPEGNYLSEFGAYFTDRHRTPWGPAMNVDDLASDGVRNFVLHNVRHWIRDFRVDGLRLDAVHAICDQSPCHILREIKEAADEESARRQRPVHVIGESNLNDVRLIEPADRDGYCLDAVWSDDFHHAVHGLLTGERTGYYADFGPPEMLVKALNQAFVYDGCHSVYRGRRHGAPVGPHTSDRFVVSIQNHDQVGNRPAGNRIGTLLDPARQRLAAGLLLLAPQVPLIFMGEEYGETRPFPFFCEFEDRRLQEATYQGRRRELAAMGWEDDVPDPQAESTFASATLQWTWQEGSQQADMRRLYYDLLMIRRYWLPHGGSREHTASALPGRDGSAAILRLVHGATAAREQLSLIALFNLTSGEQSPPADSPGEFRLLLASESASYGGKRAPSDGPGSLLPFEFWVLGFTSGEAA